MRPEDAERARLFADYAESGDVAIRDRLVESYIPLALYFARRYERSGVEAEDLQQVAKLALVKAVERFDPDRGVQFSTFAGRTINGECKRHLRDKAWSVRVPRGLQESAQEIRRLIDHLTAELGRAPSVRELAERSGYDDETVLEALDVDTAYRAASLDTPAAGDDPGATVGATLGDHERGYGDTEDQLTVQGLLATLPERERTIVELRFYERLSQSEIAERVGVSQMHVSRLLRRSLAQLAEQAGDLRERRTDRPVP